MSDLDKHVKEIQSHFDLGYSYEESLMFGASRAGKDLIQLEDNELSYLLEYFKEYASKPEEKSK